MKTTSKEDRPILSIVLQITPEHKVVDIIKTINSTPWDSEVELVIYASSKFLAEDILGSPECERSKYSEDIESNILVAEVCGSWNEIRNTAIEELGSRFVCFLSPGSEFVNFDLGVLSESESKLIFPQYRDETSDRGDEFYKTGLEYLNRYSQVPVSSEAIIYDLEFLKMNEILFDTAELGDTGFLCELTWTLMRLERLHSGDWEMLVQETDDCISLALTKKVPDTNIIGDILKSWTKVREKESNVYIQEDCKSLFYKRLSDRKSVV